MKPAFRIAPAPRRVDHLDANVLERCPALGAYAARVGGTPLIEVPTTRGSARIFAKCEGDNPSGSTKDRVAFAMLYRMFVERKNTTDLRVFEYSAGGLAYGLAYLCRELGIPLRLVLSSASSERTRADLESMGASLDIVDRALGFYAVIEHAHTVARSHPRLVFLSQHTNPANLWIHRTTTGWEIAHQLPAGIVADAWVASIGTGGTLRGVAEVLAAHNPELQVFAVSPDELPYGSTAAPNGLPKFAGSGGFGLGRKQPFVEPWERALDGHFTVAYVDSLREVRDFAQRTGMRLGTSAAANLMAARTVAERLGPARTVVTIFPSYATPDEWSIACGGGLRAV